MTKDAAMKALLNAAERLSSDPNLAQAEIGIRDVAIEVVPKFVSDTPVACAFIEFLDESSVVIEMGRESHYDLDTDCPRALIDEVLAVVSAIVQEGLTETLWIKDDKVVASKVQFADGSTIHNHSLKSRRGARVETVTYLPYPGGKPSPIE